MKTIIDTVNILLVDGRQALHYRLLDDKDVELKKGVAFVTLDKATVDAVTVDAIAKLAADLSALALPPSTAPQAVTDAVAQLGLTREATEAERARGAKARKDADALDALLATKADEAVKAQADLASAKVLADEAIAQKQAEKDRLDAEIAARKVAIADTVPAAAETKPGGLTP